jgi:excisionase family DNA binding protein
MFDHARKMAIAIMPSTTSRQVASSLSVGFIVTRQCTIKLVNEIQDETSIRWSELMDTISIPFQIKVEVSPEASKFLASLVASISVDLPPRRMTPKEQAQHAHFAGQKPPTEFGLLIDMREASKLLKVSERTIYGMHTQGRMPKPIRIGSAVRWPYNQLQAWVDAGCPGADRWKYEPKA